MPADVEEWMRTAWGMEDRERAVRRLSSEGSATMPAFRYALRPEQIDSIIAYLERVETLRPPVVDRLVEREELQRLKAETRP